MAKKLLSNQKRIALAHGDFDCTVLEKHGRSLASAVNMHIGTLAIPIRTLASE